MDGFEIGLSLALDSRLAESMGRAERDVALLRKALAGRGPDAGKIREAGVKAASGLASGRSGATQQTRAASLPHHASESTARKPLAAPVPAGTFGNDTLGRQRAVAETRAAGPADSARARAGGARLRDGQIAPPREPAMTAGALMRAIGRAGAQAAKQPGSQRGASTRSEAKPESGHRRGVAVQDSALPSPAALPAVVGMGARDSAGSAGAAAGTAARAAPAVAGQPVLARAPRPVEAVQEAPARAGFAAPPGGIAASAAAAAADAYGGQPAAVAPRPGNSGVAETDARSTSLAGGPWAGSMPGGVGSLAAPEPAATPARMEGDVFLDGSLVGRWMSRYLNDQSSRANAGPTGYDGRRGQILPGAFPA